jgi:hypothetical protein
MGSVYPLLKTGEVMKKSYSVIGAAILGLSLSTPAVFGADMALPNKVVVETTTTGANITAIDKANRTFTLRANDGKTRTLKAPPEMVNFDQMKVGDQVKATYAQEMAFNVRKAGMPPEADEGTAVVKAPKGDKPGVVLAESKTITGVVTAIDHKTRMVTLKGPKGNELTFPVKKSVKGLENVKKGDDVVISYTEALAISVVTP